MKEPWISFAGDVNSPLLRNTIWTKSLDYYDKELGLPRPDYGVFCTGDKMEYLIKESSTSAVHKELTKKVNKDVFLLRRIIKKTIQIGEEMNNFTEKIFNSDLNDILPK